MAQLVLFMLFVLSHVLFAPLPQTMCKDYGISRKRNIVKHDGTAMRTLAFRCHSGCVPNIFP